MDLTFYDQYKNANSNFGIILTIIDINTRYAYGYMLKNKDQHTVKNALVEFIKDVEKNK